MLQTTTRKISRSVTRNGPKRQHIRIPSIRDFGIGRGFQRPCSSVYQSARRQNVTHGRAICSVWGESLGLVVGRQSLVVSEQRPSEAKAFQPADSLHPVEPRTTNG